MRRSCSFKITKHPPWQLRHNPADFSCYFAVLSASLNVNPITQAFVFSNKGTVFRGSVSSGFNHLSWGELTNNHLGIPFMTDLGKRMKEGVVWRKRRRGRFAPPLFFVGFFFDKCIGFPHSSSKPEHDIPPATDGNDFRVAIFLDWTVAYFRSLQSLLKEGRKKAQLWIFPGPCGRKLPVLLLRSPVPVGQPRQTCFLFPFRPSL